MRTLFYYYKTDDEWIFQNGMKFTDDQEAIKYIAEKRRQGFINWRLYLDLPEDLEMIKMIFKNIKNNE